jgi:hypothetical protein
VGNGTLSLSLCELIIHPASSKDYLGKGELDLMDTNRRGKSIYLMSDYGTWKWNMECGIKAYVVDEAFGIM